MKKTEFKFEIGQRIQTTHREDTRQGIITERGDVDGKITYSVMFADLDRILPEAFLKPVD